MLGDSEDLRRRGTGLPDNHKFSGGKRENIRRRRTQKIKISQAPDKSDDDDVEVTCANSPMEYK